MNVSFYRPASAVLLRVSTGSPRRVCSAHSFSGRSNSKSNYRYEHTRQTQNIQGCKAIMKQPYEQVWTNHDQQSKPTTGEQNPDVCGCHGEHLEGCPNAGRPFKPTTGQEWTAEKLYEAVCLKGYYNFAQELNASIAAERKASDKIAENARQLHIYNQKLRSQLIVQQKLWRLLSAAPSS